MPPLISYDSDEDNDIPLAWNTINTSARYAQIPDSLTHMTKENPDNLIEKMVIDTNLGPRVNYYSRKAIEVAQTVKNIQGKLVKFSHRKIHEAVLNGAVMIPESFTKAQILTADEILGTDIEYKQGIYTEKTQSKNSEKTDPTSSDIALEMDLIFDENWTMLISLGIPYNYTMILSVKDKSFESCQQRQ